ncbi:MAG TPA: hypothetical protein G4O03_01790 [Dehalococcoidia bacterium]|nr:hypothetical protein [Dehalococcoidia bacterium]
MARERKQTVAEKVIAFRVSEPTFQALERLKRRHARSWPELTLKGIVRAFGGGSEEDAQDCRQVEAELRGEVTVGQAQPSEALAEVTETEAESSEAIEADETPATEEALVAQASATTNDEPQKLVAAVVTCKGCQGRMTRGTLVVKRANGYYHPDCVPAAAGA